MSERNSASPASPLGDYDANTKDTKGTKDTEERPDVNKESFVLCVLGVLCVEACGSRPSPSAAPPRLGFSSAAFDKERDLEQRLRAGVSADQISTFHEMV